MRFIFVYCIAEIQVMQMKLTEERQIFGARTGTNIS